MQQHPTALSVLTTEESNEELKYVKTVCRRANFSANRMDCLCIHNVQMN